MVQVGCIVFLIIIHKSLENCSLLLLWNNSDNLTHLSVVNKGKINFYCILQNKQTKNTKTQCTKRRTWCWQHSAEDLDGILKITTSAKFFNFTSVQQEECFNRRMTSKIRSKLIPETMKRADIRLLEWLRPKTYNETLKILGLC